MTQQPHHAAVDSFIPGKTFIPTITPEQTGVVLAHLKDLPSGTTTKALASALGLSATAASPLLKQLCDMGLLRQTASCNIRVYQLVELLTSDQHLRHDQAEAILAFLQGRREMVPAIARTCHLTLQEAFATCQALVQRGQLHTVIVGAAFIYFHPPKVQRGRAEQGHAEVAGGPQ